MFRRFLNDQRGSGGATVSIKGVCLILILLMLSAVIIDGLYITTGYFYIKTQMDMSNRAVYAKIDHIKLADREFYIDKTEGEKQFYKYLKGNLKIDSNLVPIANGFNIIGPIKIMDFKIYNIEDLPNVTPVGTYVDMVSVHSRIEVTIRPIFFGWFGDVTIQPYIDTDLPDKLLKAL